MIWIYLEVLKCKVPPVSSSILIVGFGQTVKLREGKVWPIDCHLSAEALKRPLHTRGTSTLTTLLHNPAVNIDRKDRLRYACESTCRHVSDISYTHTFRCRCVAFVGGNLTKGAEMRQRDMKPQIVHLTDIW